MAKPKLTYLEEIVWDALKNPICPQEHRYKGPGGSLPCRWCRTAQAVMSVLKKMDVEKLTPQEMTGLIARDLVAMEARAASEAEKRLEVAKGAGRKAAL